MGGKSYDSAAYLDAVERGLGGPLSAPSSREPPWDLRHHLESNAIRLGEEHVVETLLGDLERWRRHHRS